MTKPASKLPRRLLIIIASVILVVLAAHFAGVALMRYYTEEILHPALPRGTQIREVHLNLFTGVLEIDDFELRNDDQMWITVGRLELKISPWRLLGGELHVQRARLSDGFLRVVRGQDGAYDLGVPPFGAQEPAPEDAEPPPFSLAGAVLEQITVEYHDGEFNSRLRLDRLDIGAYSARAKTQEIPLSWRLSVDERDISGQARLTLDQQQLSAAGDLKTAMLDLARVQRLAALAPLVKGEVAYDGEFSWQEPRLTLKGAVQAPEARYKVGDRLITITGGDLPIVEFALTTAPDLVAELAPGKGSRAARIQWKAGDKLAFAEDVRILGAFRYEDNKLVNVDGLDFGGGNLEWQDSGQRVKLADFAVSGVLHQGIAGELVLPSANLQLRAKRAEFDDAEAALSIGLDDLSVKDLKLRPVEGGKGRRHIEGQLSVAAGRVGRADSVLQWSTFTAGLGGTVGLSEVAVLSDLELSSLKLADPALVNGPLQIAKITADGVQFSGESRFDRLQLQGIELPGEPPESGLKVGTLSFGGGSFAAASGIDLGDIVIDGLQTAVIRDKSGQWRHPGTAVSPQGPEPQAAQAEPAEKAAMAWRVGSLKVTGDSYVITGDRTNPAAVPLKQKIDVLEVGEVATARPDQDTPFEIRMHPEKYTRFQIKGVVRPVADPLYLKAEGELAGLGLPRLNGYIQNDLGHKFNGGQLDTRFDVQIADNTLKMGNFLELHKADAEALEGKDGPPLTTAIALLEDRDGYVKIDVPVEGRLDDPDFRILAALNPVIMKAVAGTAALAIQPLGSVLLVGSLVADQAFKVTFNPALFAAGSTELDPDAKKYLADLSDKLKEKPKLALRVCGVVAEADRKKDDKGAYLDKEEDLLEMAQQRADAVRTYMSSQGTGEKQLRSCRPRLDAEADAKPRVEIRL